jgi:hypothetical protein
MQRAIVKAHLQSGLRRGPYYIDIRNTALLILYIEYKRAEYLLLTVINSSFIIFQFLKSPRLLWVPNCLYDIYIVFQKLKQLP